MTNIKPGWGDTPIYVYNKLYKGFHTNVIFPKKILKIYVQWFFKNQWNLQWWTENYFRFMLNGDFLFKMPSDSHIHFFFCNSTSQNFYENDDLICYEME